MTIWSLPLCRTCICEDEEARVRRNAGGNRLLHSTSFDALEEGDSTRYPAVQAPICVTKLRGFPTYSSAPDQPLLGVPIREGGLWHLSLQDRFEPVTFNHYVNGFSFSTVDGLETSVSLSPFSLVRNCRFQSEECSKLKSFKVSLPDHDPCFYFAVRSVHEREAEEERSDWVLSISHTILLITNSLLPSFSVTCDPIRNMPQTRQRLMAGFLIHRDDKNSISVLFCELHAHRGSSARMLLYENDLCENPVTELTITESSVCVDVVGINCSCFILDCHQFASQTPSERKVWLRAISNVKVKIQNGAPDASDEELEHYRSAIREHIYGIQATLEPTVVSEPLLAHGPRKIPTMVLSSDVETPDTPSQAPVRVREPHTQVSL